MLYFIPIIKGHDRNIRRRQSERGVAGLSEPREVKRAALLILFVPPKRLLVRHFLDVIRAPRPGQFLARATASSVEMSSVEINPFSAPRTRSFLVSARVSMPLMPGMPFFSKYSAREISARQLLTTGEISRTTNPADVRLPGFHVRRD